MAYLGLFIALLLVIVTNQGALALPVLGGGSGFGPGSGSGRCFNSKTHVPVTPIAIIPETDFIPVSNILPVVNVFPTEYNDYSRIVYGYGGWPNGGGCGGWGPF
ncbi:hypothetical protein BGZ65_000896 [Modicella reniformis]|uniref:Uncharacterized protein n=1 Tax=Modicella reniformis TaxID=1440133 RepID=A0A9P6J6F9_9FUNG|nr:hypothetical protein BGZ65_000896 [Modicella reniformis]